MQLIPPTARRVAGELGEEFAPERLKRAAYNLRFGAFYLAKVLGLFADHVPLAAASYNAGPQAVSHWLASGETLPLDVFVARIPYRETRHYVMRVVGNMARYAYLQDGEDAIPGLDLALPQGLRAGPDAY
jgi:soluble lytic murein transglycosylase